MHKESPTIETVKKPEAREKLEVSQSVESPEDLRRQIISESEKETVEFKNECAGDLAQAEAMAEKDGLMIDNEDKKELQELSKKAEVAREELAGEAVSKNNDKIEQGAYLQEMHAFLLECKNFHKKDEEKRLFENFLKPYREGKASFRELFKDSKTAPLAAEALRMILISKQDDLSSQNKDAEHEFIFDDLASSLDVISVQLKGNDFEESKSDFGPSRRKYRNNALYAISEALDSTSANNRKKINIWLEEHLEDLEESSKLHTTPDKSTDHIDITFQDWTEYGIISE